MHNNKDEITLKSAINRLLKAYGLEEKMNETKIIIAWEKVMGKVIANYTNNIKIKDKKLIIELKSSALREELSYAKEKIIDTLNKEVGKKVINGIILK